MAHYTTELRKIAAWPALNEVLAEYPIHRENNRKLVNELFLKRYWFREIGYETAEMFVQRLDYKLSEIMPFYNEVFKSTDLDYDMLTNIDVRTESENEASTALVGEASNALAGSNTARSESASDQFDMPQTQVDQSGDYLTSRGTSQGVTGSESNQEGSESRRDESDAASSGKSSTKGRSGVSGAQLILDYRSAILNVNSLIVDDLGVLFLHVWRPVSRDH